MIDYYSFRSSAWTKTEFFCDDVMVQAEMGNGKRETKSTYRSSNNGGRKSMPIKLSQPTCGRHGWDNRLSYQLGIALLHLLHLSAGREARVQLHRTQNLVFVGMVDTCVVPRRGKAKLIMAVAVQLAFFIISSCHHLRQSSIGNRNNSPQLLGRLLT